MATNRNQHKGRGGRFIIRSVSKNDPTLRAYAVPCADALIRESNSTDSMTTSPLEKINGGGDCSAIYSEEFLA